MIATLFQKLDVTIIEPEYIGLNGLIEGSGRFDAHGLRA